MKHLPLLLVLLSGLALGLVALRADDPNYVVPTEGTGVPAHLPGGLAEGLEVQRFEVEGMCTCSGCPTVLYKALLGVEEVAHAAIDTAIGQAKVQVAEGTDPSRVAAALTFEDYSARYLGD